MTTIVVIGLGYVGLPLALALAEGSECHGLDRDAVRVDELRRGHDRNREVPPARLAATRLVVTADAAALPAADFYIVTVPTPVDAQLQPDLRLLVDACTTVGTLLSSAGAKRAPVVIVESSVHPGVTETICAPAIERADLLCGRDFFMAYSPERISPGDEDHSVERITKVVAGQTPDVLDRVAALYEGVTRGGVFRATSIRAAEAAKMVENVQRDVNIALINELTRVFAAMDLSIWDVLDGARTKWNFLDFRPGFVGGHCVAVDPYYLALAARAAGVVPRLVETGRTINEDMAAWAVDAIDRACGARGTALVLGTTFKENIRDLRNSKIPDIAHGLAALGHAVTVHDPHADAESTMALYGLRLDPEALARRYDLVVLAVPHAAYVAMGAEGIGALAADGGLIADMKRALPELVPEPGRRVWRF